MPLPGREIDLSTSICASRGRRLQSHRDSDADARRPRQDARLISRIFTELRHYIQRVPLRSYVVSPELWPGCSSSHMVWSSPRNHWAWQRAVGSPVTMSLLRYVPYRARFRGRLHGYWQRLQPSSCRTACDDARRAGGSDSHVPGLSLHLSLWRRHRRYCRTTVAAFGVIAVVTGPRW